MKNKIKSYFDEKKVQYIDNNSILSFGVNGKDAFWTTAVRADEDGIVNIYSIVPTKVPAERYDAFVKMVNAMNVNVRYGSFELVTEGDGAGEARCRTSVFIPKTFDDAAFTELLDSVLTLHEGIMDAFAAEMVKAACSDSED